MANDTELGLVLLPGSELGSWIWPETKALLTRPSLAVDLPGRAADDTGRRSLRLTDAHRSVVAAIDRWAVERVVLVAHSFAGTLVPAVAAARPDRVAAAVWVGGTVTEPGGSWVGTLALPQRLLLRAMYRAKPGGLLSPAAAYRKSLCHDLDAKTTERVLRRRVVEPPGFLLDHSEPATLPVRVGAHYVRMRDDRAVTAAMSTKMLRRLPGAVVHDLPGGHLPMLARPAELAALLDEICRQHEQLRWDSAVGDGQER